MTPTEQQPDSPAHEPVTATRWRAVLLASVAACAACGIIYELALLTLSTSLNGGAIVPPSLILAGYIAALGAGALLVKPLLHWAAIAFVAVEALLAIVGGLSAAALYVMFSFIGGSLLMLALGTVLIGALVGAEVPLLMTLLQRGRTAGATDTGRTLANLNAADYLGALIGGLAWPFVLLPHLGMIRGAAATGIVNLLAAAVVSVFLLRRVVSTRQLIAALGALGLALALLATLLPRAQDIETTSRQRLYADPIIAWRQSAYQEIVVTRRGNDMRLYLDGGLQFSTRDEYRYTESLVYPVLGAGARSVLVLGGGDRVLCAGVPRAGSGWADGGAVRQPVLNPNCVLAHDFHYHRSRLRGHAVPRLCADVRRLGLCAGAKGRQGAATSAAARRAAAALSQPVSTRRSDSVRSGRATTPTGAVNAGTPARRRRHAPRLRLVKPTRSKPKSTAARESAKAMHAGVDLGATRGGSGRGMPDRR